MSFNQVLKRMPLAQCVACGSTWFREVSFTEFKSKQSWPPPEPLAYIPMTVLICLCGRQFPLVPQGGRGPTMTEAIRRFRVSLETQEREEDYAVVPTGVGRELLSVFYGPMRKLEDEVGRQLAQQDVAAGQRQARGRFWRGIPRPTGPAYPIIHDLRECHQGP